MLLVQGVNTQWFGMIAHLKVGRREVEKTGAGSILKRNMSRDKLLTPILSFWNPFLFFDFACFRLPDNGLASVAFISIKLVVIQG